MNMVKKVHLKRELGLFAAVACGVGIILGAGIYALIGPAAGLAGNALWASFLIAAVIAAFTGLSYAEMVSIFSSDAAEYVYVEEAFGKKAWAFITGWFTIFIGIIGAAAVSIGFGGYFSSLFGIGIVPSALILVFLLSLLNFRGIKESIGFNIIATLIEFGGLLLIIILGISFFGSVDYTQMGSLGFNGILQTAALIFFAYIGFDSIVKLSEETKDPTKTLPKALIFSIIITTLLYVFVAIAVVSVVPYSELAESSAPLALVASEATTGSSVQWGLLLSIIALFATANTILILLIVSSRMIYGMAEEKSLPAMLCKVHKKRRTPYISIFLTMFLVMAFVLIGDLATIANITNLFAFIVFSFVNLSLIWIRFKRPHLKGKFRSPINIGNFPVLAFLGVLSSLFMLTQFDYVVFGLGGGVTLVGYIVYRTLNL